MVKLDYTADSDRFSVAWWSARIRNVFWVAVITVLIWVYADLEVTEPREFEINVVLMAGRPGVALLAPEEKTLAVTFVGRGSRGSLDQFARWVAESGEPIMCDLSGLEVGEHEVRLQDLLSNSEQLRDYGVSVETALPEKVAIWLDELVTRGVVVALDYENGLPEQVQIDPPKVAVTAARNAWDRIDQAEAEPVVKTVRKDLGQLAAGQVETFAIRLVGAIDGEQVTVEPQTVSVSLTVSQRADTRTIPVNVDILQPTAWTSDETWAQYVLVRKDPLAWRVEISVTGAQKDLDQLRPEDIHAFIELTEDDKRPVESWLTREAKIRFPKGLQLRVVGEAPAVEFRMEARNGGVTPPA